MKSIRLSGQDRAMILLRWLYITPNVDGVFGGVRDSILSQHYHRVGPLDPGRGNSSGDGDLFPRGHRFTATTRFGCGPVGDCRGSGAGDFPPFCLEYEDV